MEVKGVIEIIEKYVKALEILKEPESKLYTALKEIVPLLQQGEKYRQMEKELWNDIEEKEERCEVACDIVYVSQLRKLKQKYFPKECKMYKECYRCGQEYACMIRKNKKEKEANQNKG